MSKKVINAVDFRVKTGYNVTEVKCMLENICHYVPYRKDYNTLQTVHFVLETKIINMEKFKSGSLFKMYCVKQGKGLLHTSGRVHKLKEGDVFFTFPARDFRIEGEAGFVYMYISFLGVRANQIFDKLKIDSKNCVFAGTPELLRLWENGINIGSDPMGTVSEGVLLYTFGILGTRFEEKQGQKEKGEQSINIIKKYVDENFSDEDFSLEKMSSVLGYNPKYISQLFKKKMSVGINEYLNTVRVQSACTMIEQGTTSVSDIAMRCGFRDAQYFSKVFKSKTGMSPTEYMKNK